MEHTGVGRVAQAIRRGKGPEEDGVVGLGHGRARVRAGGADKAAQDLFFGSGVISDTDLNTRLAAFVKLSDFATTPEIQTLVKKLSSDPVVKNDEWLAEAAKMLGKKHKALNYKEGPNLLPNPGFEEPSGDTWKQRDYGNRPGNKDAQWGFVTDPKMLAPMRAALAKTIEYFTAINTEILATASASSVAETQTQTRSVA